MRALCFVGLRWFTKFHTLGFRPILPSRTFESIPIFVHAFDMDPEEKLSQEDTVGTKNLEDHLKINVERQGLWSGAYGLHESNHESQAF